MGDRLATIDIGRKVRGGVAVSLSISTEQLPTFRSMSIVYVYVSFGTDHFRIETQVDENQLVRVETNNFMRVVRLCLVT